MYQSTKIIELGSCAFRQPKAKSHCRHIHGYRLISKLWFTASALDENNWVMDFGALKDLKTRLEHTFDHTLCISSDDPQIDLFGQLASADAANLVVFDGGVGIEKFAKKVFEIANDFVVEKTNGRVWVTKVEVWEHEKNSAIYIGSLEENIAKQIDITETSTLEPALNAVEEIKLDVPAPTTPPQEENPYAARVGNQVTKGWSNPFAGTSWGV